MYFFRIFCVLITANNLVRPHSGCETDIESKSAKAGSFVFPSKSSLIDLKSKISLNGFPLLILLSFTQFYCDFMREIIKWKLKVSNSEFQRNKILNYRKVVIFVYFEIRFYKKHGYSDYSCKGKHTE